MSNTSKAFKPMIFKTTNLSTTHQTTFSPGMISIPFEKVVRAITTHTYAPIPVSQTINASVISPGFIGKQNVQRAYYYLNDFMQKVFKSTITSSDVKLMYQLCDLVILGRAALMNDGKVLILQPDQELPPSIEAEAGTNILSKLKICKWLKQYATTYVSPDAIKRDVYTYFQEHYLSEIFNAKSLIFQNTLGIVTKNAQRADVRVYPDRVDMDNWITTLNLFEIMVILDNHASMRKEFLSFIIGLHALTYGNRKINNANTTIGKTIHLTNVRSIIPIYTGNIKVDKVGTFVGTHGHENSRVSLLYFIYLAIKDITL